MDLTNRENLEKRIEEAFIGFQRGKSREAMITLLANDILQPSPPEESKGYEEDEVLDLMANFATLYHRNRTKGIDTGCRTFAKDYLNNIWNISTHPQPQGKEEGLEGNPEDAAFRF